MKGASGTIAAPDTVQGSPAQLACQHVQIQINLWHMKQCCGQQPHFASVKPLK